MGFLLVLASACSPESSLGAVNQAKTATIVDLLAEWLAGLTWTNA
jgi:hypothetical protein